MSPQNLQVEHQLTPAAVATVAPRFGWQLEPSTATRIDQAAYQLQVATSAERLTAGKPDLWDSGRIPSDRSWNVPYGGTALAAGAVAHWRVRVWTSAADSGASEWSAPTRFGVGLLREQDWKADWIGLSDDSGVPTGRTWHVPALTAADLIPWQQVRAERTASIRLRHAFEISDSPAEATMHLCGLGHYRVFCNGQPVGNDVLQPAWSDYDLRCYTNTYDLTALLRPGRNVVAVLLGNGFFNAVGGAGRYAKLHVSFGAPKLRLHAKLRFKDGREQLVSSSPGWRVSPSAITFNCIYGGEDFDARRQDSAWTSVAYDDDAWAAARVVSPPRGELIAQQSAPLRRARRHTGHGLGEIVPGVWLYDLEQNHAGFPDLRVTGPAGAVVRLIPGEALTPDGYVDQGSASGPNSKGRTFFSYTLKGGGTEESWSPEFSYYGYRYLQAELSPPPDGGAEERPAIKALGSWELESSLATTGSWSSSSPMVNRVHQLILAAARSNLQHVLTDCPHREKLGWLEVSYLMGPSLAFNFDLRRFLPKVLDDIGDAQQPNGLIPDHAPEYCVFEDGFRDSPEWGSAIFHLSDLAYQWYGDDAPARRHYPAMRRYADYLLSKRRDGLLEHGLSDWMDASPPDGSLPGPCQLTSQGLTATATLIRNLRVLARLAPLAGAAAEAAGWTQLADETRAAFNHRFFKPGEGTYDTGSPTALALPLALDLVPAGAIPTIVAQLRRRIEADGHHIRTGDIGHVYVIEALARHGGNDLLWKLVTRLTPPSYGGMIATGATTLTEDWNADRRLSLNHLMLGHIEQWFYRHLAGLRPELGAPAWRGTVVSPWFAPELDHVVASCDSPHGAFSVAWRREDKIRIRLDLNVPPNTTARFVTPAGYTVAGTSGRTPGAPVLDVVPPGAWTFVLSRDRN